MPQIDERYINTEHEKHNDNIKNEMNRFYSGRSLSFIDKSDPVSISIAYLFISTREFDRSGNAILRGSSKRLSDNKHLKDIVEIYKAYKIQDMLEVFYNFNNNLDATPRVKQEIINTISKIYDSYKKENKLSWIKKNDHEQSLWLKKYISNNRLLNRSLDILNKEELIHITAPALIYTIGFSDSERELFIIKMRQAWGQVKYRKKIKKENKVSFNFVTDKRTKNNLKKLSEQYDLTMNETLERLINAAAGK
ncbi:hypothetical protein ACM6XU_002780 [Vibrio parahaemolyticus]